MSTSILLDPYVEATARLMCQEAGLDPDMIVPIPDAVITIDGQERPVAMTGPQWMTYAVEAGQRLNEAEKRMAAQFVQATGRA